MKRILFVTVALLFYTVYATGQDVHFTQFYNNPMLLNPALTGNNKCILRAGMGYRDQWWKVSLPYKTYDFFIDGKIQPYELKRDWFGVGLSIVTDKSGSGILKNNDFRLFLSYNKGLIEKNKLVFSIGVAAGIISRNVDKWKISFDNQWTGTHFDPYLEDGENMTINSRRAFDLNVGGVITYVFKERLNAHAGASIRHVNCPQLSLLSSTIPMSWGYLYHAGCNAVLNKTSTLMVKAYYYFKDESDELVFGFNTSRVTRKEPFYIGLWYRWNRDISPLIGFGHKGWTFMFNYDINISKFTQATDYHTAFEISISKSLLCDSKFTKKPDRRYKTGTVETCPLF